MTLEQVKERLDKLSVIMNDRDVVYNEVYSEKAGILFSSVVLVDKLGHSQTYTFHNKELVFVGGINVYIHEIERMNNFYKQV